MVPVAGVSNGGWVCRFDTLGQWPSPHSRHQCTLVAEALVIIPVVTAMPAVAGGGDDGGALDKYVKAVQLGSVAW